MQSILPLGSELSKMAMFMRERKWCHSNHFFSVDSYDLKSLSFKWYLITFEMPRVSYRRLVGKMNISLQYSVYVSVIRGPWSISKWGVDFFCMNHGFMMMNSWRISNDNATTRRVVWVWYNSAVGWWCYLVANVIHSQPSSRTMRN